MMKKNTICLFLFLFTAGISNTLAQITPVQPNPLGLKDTWTKNELMEPAELAAAIKANKAPVIFNIGSVEDIKGAVHIGAGNKPASIEKLQKAAAAVPKGAKIVIYCGCCPFNKCPNIRPAFNALKAMRLTNIKLLNIRENLNANWKSKGYPMQAE